MNMNSTINEILRACLIEILKRDDYTERKLAESVHCSQTQINMLKNGRVSFENLALGTACRLFPELLTAIEKMRPAPQRIGDDSSNNIQVNGSANNISSSISTEAGLRERIIAALADAERLAPADRLEAIRIVSKVK